MRTIAFPLLIAFIGAIPAIASAQVLVPHRASYDLSMRGGDGDLVDAQGRIAIEMHRKTCETYELDYRFVARFQQEQELIVTDQQTHSRESADGERFEFETKTFIDASPESAVIGTASTRGDVTRVALTAPKVRTVEVPKSMFPMQHTRALIEQAKAGTRILETRLYDGDEEVEKLLTSTAVIAPATEGGTGPDGKAAETASSDRSASPSDQLAGLAAWRISESFYNSDSDPDGLPIFQTAYTLYENGVSDDLVLTFDGYTLAGGLASLDLFEMPACP
ncbi:MAG TPA: DUF1849 family protein [Aurantimonas sp.]